MYGQTYQEYCVMLSYDFLATAWLKWSLYVESKCYTRQELVSHITFLVLVRIIVQTIFLFSLIVLKERNKERFEIIQSLKSNEFEIKKKGKMMTSEIPAKTQNTMLLHYFLGYKKYSYVPIFSQSKEEKAE